MPGKGCLERKMERRKLKRLLQDGDDGEESVSKLARVVDESLSTEKQTWYKVPDLMTLAETGGEEYELRLELCKALTEAIKEYDHGAGVQVSALGNHFKVHAIKKNQCFNNMRLADILEAHPEFFVVTRTEEVHTKWNVQLVPGGLEEVLGPLDEIGEDDTLPQPIVAPLSKDMAMQAIRIEVIRALSKRGGSAQLNDIGQDFNVNTHRMKWMKDVKMTDIIRKYPANFSLNDMGHGNFMVDLISNDCSDVGIAPGPLMKRRDSGKGKDQGDKGKGKGLGKGMVGKGMVGNGMPMVGKGKANTGHGMGMDRMSMVGKGKANGGLGMGMGWGGGAMPMGMQMQPVAPMLDPWTMNMMSMMDPYTVMMMNTCANQGGLGMGGMGVARQGMGKMMGKGKW